MTSYSVFVETIGNKRLQEIRWEFTQANRCLSPERPNKKNNTLFQESDNIVVEGLCNGFYSQKKIIPRAPP
jgi:hypothetical protein